MQSSEQLTSLGAEADRVDASAIVEVHRAVAKIRVTHRAFAGRTARESVQKIWQEPRMPRPRHTHNKPLDYPWSPAARDAYFAADTTGRLVLEHTTPINHMTAVIFERVVDPAFGADQMLEYLREVHRGLSFVVITKEEDDRLTAAGLRAAKGSGETLWSRYEAALGLGEDGFGAVTDDPRYTGAPH